MGVTRNETFEKTASAVIPCRVQWTTWLGSTTFASEPVYEVIEGDVVVGNFSTNHTTKNTVFLVGGGSTGKSVVRVTGVGHDGKVMPVYFVFKVVSEP